MSNLRVRSGVYWVEARYTNKLGKRVRLQKSTGIADDGTRINATLAEAEAMRIILEVSGVDPNGRLSAYNVASAIDANYAAKRAEGRADSTVETVTYRLDTVAKHFGPTTRLSNIGALHLLQYAAKRTEEGAAGPTIHRELSEFLRGWKLLGFTPPKMPKLAKGETQDRALTPEETEKLLAALKPHRRAMVLLCRLAGCRRSEAQTVRREGIDFDRGMVQVTGKTGPRWVPMHPNVEALLRKLVASTPRDRQLIPEWSSGSCIRDLKAACARAHVAPCNFNDLRRSFATELAMTGEGNKKVAALMGHKTTKMVDEVYARIGDRTREMHSTVGRLASYDLT